MIPNGVTIKIGDRKTTAEINLMNSQLFSLKRKDVEVMWGGGAPEGYRPKSGWQNSMIEMFPVIGAPVAGRILIDGNYFPMAQHGIARDLPWEMTRSNSYSATFEQVYEGGQEVPSKKGTISVFPRSYWLTKTYEISQGTLVFTLEVQNPSDKMLPYAVGWHPAFRAVEGSILKVLQGREQKDCIPLHRVREANGNVLEFDNSDAIKYENTEFSLALNHNFGRTQIWDKGEGLVALEPISAFSMSRAPVNTKETELGLQQGYKNLKRGERATFKANINIST